MRITWNAGGITESVQKEIQALHCKGKHPAEIAKLLKGRGSAFSDVDERAVRRYIDFTGDSKKFVAWKAGIAVKVTPTENLLKLMEERRHTHGPNGIAFELGIPHEMAKSFLNGTLELEKSGERVPEPGMRKIASGFRPPRKRE
jgi:hypothetical protein